MTLSPPHSLPCSPLSAGFALQTCSPEAVELCRLQAPLCGLEQPAFVTTTPAAVDNCPRVAAGIQTDKVMPLQCIYMYILLGHTIRYHPLVVRPRLLLTSKKNFFLQNQNLNWQYILSIVIYL